MPDAFKSNMTLMRAMDHAKDWKNRKGGIDPDAWKGISKDEKKEMAEAGLMQGGFHGAMANAGNVMSINKSNKKNEMWEHGAYEMGHGSIKTADDLRAVYQKGKEVGMGDSDSPWDAVRQFRSAGGNANQPSISSVTKEDPKKEATPTPPEDNEVQWEGPGNSRWEKEQAAQPTKPNESPTPKPVDKNNTNKFMEKYKQQVQANLTPATGSLSSQLANEAKN